MAEAAWRIILVGGVTLLALVVAFAFTKVRARRIEHRAVDLEGIAGRAVLFSSAACPSCDRVRRMLAHLGVTLEEVRLEDNPELHRSAGVESVPLLVLRDPTGSVASQVAGLPSARKLRRSLRAAGITPGL